MGARVYPVQAWLGLCCDECGIAIARGQIAYLTTTGTYCSRAHAALHTITEAPPQLAEN